MTQHFLPLTRVFRLICFLALAAVSSFAAAVEPPVWIDHNAAGERQVHLYFFWTSTCAVSRSVPSAKVMVRASLPSPVDCEDM